MIEFRAANNQDIDLLIYWDQQEHVIASDPNDDWDWEYELNRSPDWREQLIALWNGTPIGVLQIIDPAREESHYWGAVGENKRAIDIWIGEAHNLGKGYGTQMMQLALERCFSHPEVVEVLIDPLESNTKAIRFYKRLGFQFVEKRQFGADKCEVYAIKRVDWERIKSDQ